MPPKHERVIINSNHYTSVKKGSIGTLTYEHISYSKEPPLYSVLIMDGIMSGIPLSYYGHELIFIDRLIKIWTED
jgi:hypothetical protein